MLLTRKTLALLTLALMLGACTENPLEADVQADENQPQVEVRQPDAAVNDLAFTGRDSLRVHF